MLSFWLWLLFLAFFSAVSNIVLNQSCSLAFWDIFVSHPQHWQQDCWMHIELSNNGHVVTNVQIWLQSFRCQLWTINYCLNHVIRSNKSFHIGLVRLLLYSLRSSGCMWIATFWGFWGPVIPQKNFVRLYRRRTKFRYTFLAAAVCEQIQF